MTLKNKRKNNMLVIHHLGKNDTIKEVSEGRKYIYEYKRTIYKDKKVFGTSYISYSDSIEDLVEIKEAESLQYNIVDEVPFSWENRIITNTSKKINYYIVRCWIPNHGGISAGWHNRVIEKT